MVDAMEGAEHWAPTLGFAEGDGHFGAEADGFGYAAVFGVVEAGVGDLQAGDGGLDGRDLGGEAGLADGLAVAEAGDLGGEDVGAEQGGVDALEAGEGFVDEGGVGPGELWVGGGHVVGDVDMMVFVIRLLEFTVAAELFVRLCFDLRGGGWRTR